jgi:hypothetical protein
MFQDVYRGPATTDIPINRAFVGKKKKVPGLELCKESSLLKVKHLILVLYTP